MALTRSIPVPVLVSLLLVISPALQAKELHVAIRGNDANPGTRAAPLRTIQRAADLAQPGDTVTVYEGVYRERIDPPRGGLSDRRRITYQAAPRERVEIRGSEVVKAWTRVKEGVWKVTLPNSFFGAFNPYTNQIRGDWFEPRNRPHHTGAVYLNGEWLVEAARLDEVLTPSDTPPPWLTGPADPYLLNVAWFRPDSPTGVKVPASAFASQQGVQTAPCEEGGQCIGWIEHGDWVRYENVDLGSGTESVEIRAASATAGGVIEVRLDSPQGDLLGTCRVPNTGGWQTWSTFKARIKPLGGARTLCLAFRPANLRSPDLSWKDLRLWFAEANESTTTIWAQFKDINPNEQAVEINVRQTVFYPSQPGRNFITVRGFALRHAATPWAPPTAEQIGLIGTHWSKGWVIEDNVVSHSVCSGIALGKHGDRWDNTSANSAEGYVKTIERAYERGWTRENIGHHIVRNNTISHCEQAGIVGSLGAAFSTVSGNTIHDIHVRRLFTGAEMAGIKFHAAIDSVIRDNHIYRTCLGLWLDWMAQGTRVSRNLFHDNGQDLFVEVNHGPFVVDNNLFLSAANLLDVSEGGAYAHNLFAGRITSAPEPNRDTPYHPPHTTALAGLVKTTGGDNRFYNNLFVDRSGSTNSTCGLASYDKREFPLQTGGNVYYNGAKPWKAEKHPVIADTNPDLQLLHESGQWLLLFRAGDKVRQAKTEPVTTASLGTAKVSGARYENADGSPLSVATDYFGKKRSRTHPTPGPFENLAKIPPVWVDPPPKR